MSALFICGLGAVSPAGWGVNALREALNKGEPLPIQPLPRPGWKEPFRSRRVPAPSPKPAFMAHPRLRRTSAITHYSAACGLEALVRVRSKGLTTPRLGVIVCLHSGCVQYSCQFFEEMMRDPTTASPLLFPETVFAAPASHVSALLGNVPLAYTLIGDPASFLQGLAVAADWLEDGRVDACVVIGAEETNWMRADAMWHLEHGAIISDGAGALCLSLDPALSLGVRLEAITDAHTFRTVAGPPPHEPQWERDGPLSLSLSHLEGERVPKAGVGVVHGFKAGTGSGNSLANRLEEESVLTASRRHAARAMRQQLPPASPSELLCDGLGNSARTDAPEISAWRDWTGPRLSPKRILGEGLMAGAAWQCVAAADAVARNQFPAANVSLVGCNQQAIGSRFIRANSGGQPT